MEIILRFFLLGFVVSMSSGMCPDAEDLAPKCFCLDSSSDGGSLFCDNLLNPMELLGPVGACTDYRMFSMIIRNSTLRFLPHDLFKGTTFEKLMFIHTQLMSLSDGDLAFEGLEKHMTEIRARDIQYVAQWQFSQLRNLKKINLIDIHLIHMGALADDLPHLPELTAIGLVKTGLSHIGNYAFNGCPKLTLLDLNGNELTEMKRTMLPNPADRLSLLNLDDNHLSSLPANFFENMPNLHDVFLRNNQFTTIGQKMFSILLQYINELQLSGNPIICDCRMKWILNHRQPLYFTAKCAKPASLKGSEIKYLVATALHC